MIKIHKVTCSILDVNYFRTFTKTRKREIVSARQITMVISYRLLKKKGASLQDIADFFNMDHASVSHAIDVIGNLSFVYYDFWNKYLFVEEKAREIIKKNISENELTITPVSIIIELKKLNLKSDEIDKKSFVIQSNVLLNQLQKII